MQPDGCWGLCPQTPEVYPLWRYPVEDMKNSNSVAVVFHRFISQPAWSCSSALLSFGCIFSVVIFWWIMRLHSLFFRPLFSLRKPFFNTRSMILCVNICIKTITVFFLSCISWILTTLIRCVSIFFIRIYIKFLM